MRSTPQARDVTNGQRLGAGIGSYEALVKCASRLSIRNGLWLLSRRVSMQANDKCADTKNLDSSATDFALRGILARRISQERLNELLNCPHHCRAGAKPFDPAQIAKF